MKFSIKNFFNKCDHWRDSGTGVFSVNFAKFLRTTFLKKHLRQLILEVDFTVMSLICNIYKPVFHKMISWNVSAFAFIDLSTNYSCIFSMSSMIRENVLKIHASNIKAKLSSKIKNSPFGLEKNIQEPLRNIYNIYPKSIWILWLRFVR